jgi:hypothetical protein
MRTSPKLSDLRANTTTLGESLPTTSRTMTFRLTARDNSAVDYGSTSVSVTSAAGPFVVTAPNTALTWNGNSTQNVTWNVANTASAPVSCANVKILLSNDRGFTFPTTLLASTPNDGHSSDRSPERRHERRAHPRRMRDIPCRPSTSQSPNQSTSSRPRPPPRTWT